MHLQSLFTFLTKKVDAITIWLERTAAFGKASNLSAGVVKECFTKVKVENYFIELFVDEEGNVSVGH